MKKTVFILSLLLLFAPLVLADVSTHNPIIQDESSTISGGSGRIISYEGAGVTGTFAGGKYHITIPGAVGGNGTGNVTAEGLAVTQIPYALNATGVDSSANLTYNDTIQLLTLNGNQTMSNATWLGTGSATSRIDFANQTAMSIMNASVGIGTTSPTCLLDVNGTVNMIAGNIGANAITTVASQNMTNFYNRTEADTAFEAEITNSAGLLAALSDETGTLLAVFSEAPTINNISLGGTPVYPDGSIAEADLDMNNSPANNLIIKYNATGSGKMEWAADATGGAVGKWTVETKTDNYSVLTTDVAKTLVMNAAGTTTFSLPSVAEENVGTWYTFVKIGAGKVIIDAADSDKIADSGAGDTIYNDQTLEVYATITLQLVSETQWAIIGADGIWITTD